MKLLAACLLLASVALADECKRDCTGIDWTLPFKTAKEKAAREHKLLLIKPIAFGTEKNGGW